SLCEGDTFLRLTAHDFKHVIDTTVKDWSGTKYEKYLRPETLFGSKFEGYLNQAPRIKTETTDERLGF
ncbi:conserved phage C-terminal domain-containing protein, partial [Streptococcus agalactiae]|uniref:conserved phage C-terminal domain-containing protein n=1 Tax=Streptococcus agalactiae TaxID=1311 RepID=UPI003FD74D43